jgi:hypothetical protein
VTVGPGLSIAAGPKMWNRRFREDTRDSPREDSRFNSSQILLTWVLADKHYWTQLKGTEERAALFLPSRQPRGVPGLLAHEENRAPLRSDGNATASRGTPK